MLRGDRPGIWAYLGRMRDILSTNEMVLRAVRKLAGSAGGQVIEVARVASFTGLSNTAVRQSVSQLQSFEAPVRLGEGGATIILEAVAPAAAV